MQSLRSLSFLPLCLSLYLLLFGRKGLNVTAQDQREEECTTERRWGGRLFTLLSVTLLWLLKLLNHTIVSSIMSVSDRVNLHECINGCGLRWDNGYTRTG